MKRERNNYSIKDAAILRFEKGASVIPENDLLAVEEPLEIRLGFMENGEFVNRAISITMRTPGSDFELAAGFLFTEGIIKSRSEIADIKHCGAKTIESATNTVRVDLRDEVVVDLDKLKRHFYTSSSCGVCGKSSIAALNTGARKLESKQCMSFKAELIHGLPQAARQAQSVFDSTGGLHAAALFDAKGKLETLREDVGRHNAVDKLVGARFLAGALPLRDKILLVSGRASFELIQKAVMAQIPVLAAVGAPSSLAVEAAREFGMTLLGFVRDNRFNIYAGAERIRAERIR
ncbi:MAG: formate dehydrogenase accessory sulfurtransferase FdhD [Acidobacteriota bacterium]|nr:formate dehydrogenase accessory sulfurtransferase FdhD [Acidobacteriota bacterium]